MKILAIGAHPDDIEIFMFGLLYNLKRQGCKIYTIVATDGSLGGNFAKEKLVKIREKEASLGLTKISKPIFLRVPDGSLNDNSDHKQNLKIMIDKIEPDVIVTHYHKDYHSDHIQLSLVVKQIASHYIPIIYCDTMMGINFTPNYYVDITSCFEDKKRAILCHKSQSPKRFIKLVELMNRYRAAQCNAPEQNYAEGYYFKQSFPFADIRNILPKSPDLKPFHISKQHGFL